MATLTTLPPNFWNTTNVINMTECFKQCISMTTIDYEELARTIRLKERRQKIELLKIKINNGI